MNAQKLEQVQKVFANDRFATENGVVIDEVDDGYAKCSLEIQPHHLNAGGTVMGGAIFTLADFAFAVASNWNKPLNVSTTSQITFLGTAKGARLVAEARKVKEGRSTCYYLVDVSDDLGNPVAHAPGWFRICPLPKKDNADIYPLYNPPLRRRKAGHSSPKLSGPFHCNADAIFILM